MSEKLTKPQRKLLTEIASRPQPVAKVYAPANKLVHLGLARWIEGRFGDYLEITVAGGQALGISTASPAERMG